MIIVRHNGIGVGCINFLVRRYSNKRYSDSLNLPKTGFPLTLKDGAAVKREKDIQKRLGFYGLYAWQKKQHRKQDFILHDGPPYANGDPHVGHAINKILKDITNRYKVLRGFRVHYTPGWDCHGQPIELKALGDKHNARDINPLDVREKAKSFAQAAIKRQQAAFKRWGIMADWKNCYFTYNRTYEADQLEAFYKMYQKGYIYEDYMPVYWSPSSRSALAEAELEYKDDHTSAAIYMSFPLVRLPSAIKSQLGSEDTPEAIIWTTTPWTIPANKAICYGSKIEYCFSRCGKNGKVYLIEKEFLQKLSDIIGSQLDPLFTVSGSDLADSQYVHPMRPGALLPLLPGKHVVGGKGTGLVHTAPAHGQEDFHTAVDHKLPVECIVDEDGCYTAEAGASLAGLPVLSQGNEAVLGMLREHIIQQEEFVHSYPYDWRTKQPVILRASKQWFINTSTIKDRALECLKDVQVRPSSSENGMISMLNQRTYWCISRQRVWGVPIPVFYNKETGKPLITRESVDHVVKLVREQGTDCWWSLPIEELLPQHILEKHGLGCTEDYTKGKDILDIWFDSGTSWNTVLKDVGGVADVYLEGIDQFGGWFQSSLLTSVAIKDRAPYRSLLVHGFTVDEDGKKMSKSLGNVVDPSIVIDGGKDRKQQPSYGTDILRWWAANSHLHPQVSIGPAVLSQCNEAIFRVRKSLRFLLGNLHDFGEENAVDYSELLPQDRYMLHLLHEYSNKVLESYESYNFTKVLGETEKFVNSQVSSFYSTITKDRLYCEDAASASRRSAQSVLYHIVCLLNKALAPILPHMAEEIYLHQQTDKHRADSVFKSLWYDCDPEWHDPQLAAVFESVLNIREDFYTAIGSESAVDFDVVIEGDPLLMSRLKVLQSEQTSCSSPLSEVLQASYTSLLTAPPRTLPEDSQLIKGSCMVKNKDGEMCEEKYYLVILAAEKFRCGRCRRYTAEHSKQPCERCLNVMAGDWAS